MISVKNRLFHYTTGHRLFYILEWGVLKPHSIGSLKKERPAVWFTTNPSWEEMANKLSQNHYGEIRRLTMRETMVSSGGLVRIEVMPEVATVSWESFKRLSGIDSFEAELVEHLAHELGSNVERWRASFFPVPKDNWLQIQMWDGKKWRFKITN